MKVFVISLTKSLKRRENIRSQLKRENIEFNFFDAVDGEKDNNILFKQYNYLKTLWLTSGKMPLKGELGCYASHFLLWEKCIELNEPIIIIEDDVEMVTGAGNELACIQKNIIKYGFLRLEKSDKGQLTLTKKEGQKTIYYLHNNFNGARSYAITPNASRALIACRDWCMPVDNYIGSNYLHKVPSFLYTPSLVINTNKFESTIQEKKREGCPLYRKPTRELYSIYRKVAMKITNMKLCRKISLDVKK
ncbi:glycosyl transferase [Psychromonas sp. PRT-SC03]|nr:glycosyl transferase [Psychromonas sp. PRT-SC03]